MYKCNCYAGRRLTYALKEVETYDDGICVKCDHYAIWEEPDDDVTVFDSNRNLVGHFKTLDNAVEITGQDRVKIRTRLNYQGKHFMDKKYYYVNGTVDNLDNYYPNPTVHVYNFHTKEFVGTFSKMSKALKVTKDTVGSATANLENRSQHSVNGFIYTKNKSFSFENHNKVFKKEDHVYWDEYDFYEDVIDAELLL